MQTHKIIVPATDIPIFNVPEITPSKIAPPQPEKKLPSRDKKADNQNESIQDLFDYVTEDTHTPSQALSTKRVHDLSPSSR